MLDCATARAWRNGENPARWRGHLANPLPARSEVAAVQHHAVPPWAEIATSWRRSGARLGWRRALLSSLS